MGKYDRRREKKSRKWIWIICLTMFAGFLALFVMPQVLYRMNAEPTPDDATQNTVSQEQTEETQRLTEDSNTEPEPERIVEFPVVLNEGAIEIESLFPFSGVNPDADNQDAADVASIVLRNTSDQYLSEITVYATLARDATLTFIVTELPAGSSAMAFSVDNEGLLSGDICTDITVEATFGEVPNSDCVDVSVEGMMVTIVNTTGEDLNGIDVYYHDVFDDKYFGGMRYSKHIEYLPAGESTTFAAEESLLGVIEVVRVAVSNKN